MSSHSVWVWLEDFIFMFPFSHVFFFYFYLSPFQLIASRFGIAWAKSYLYVQSIRRFGSLVSFKLHSFIVLLGDVWCSLSCYILHSYFPVDFIALTSKFRLQFSVLFFFSKTLESCISFHFSFIFCDEVFFSLMQRWFIKLSELQYAILCLILIIGIYHIMPVSIISSTFNIMPGAIISSIFNQRTNESNSQQRTVPGIFYYSIIVSH